MHASASNGRERGQWRLVRADRTETKALPQGRTNRRRELMRRRGGASQEKATEEQPARYLQDRRYSRHW
jgi:hypothetical protein